MTRGISRRDFLAQSAAAGLAVAGAGVLSACGGGGEGSGSSAELNYQFLKTTDLPDAPLVQDAMNRYLKDKGKSFTVKLSPLDYDTFSKRIPLDFAAGNAGDLVYTATWINNYFTSAGAGNYLALDDLLPKYAPGLWKSIPADIWNAARVNGKIYGVINVQIWPLTWGFIARQDIMQKYGIDPQKINSYDDLTPYFAEIKKGEPSMTVWLTDNTGNGSTYVATGTGSDDVGYGLSVDPDDPNLKVFNFTASDEYRKAAELNRKWYLAGYTKQDPPAAADATAAWNNGNIAMQANQANGNIMSPFPTVEKSLMAPLLTTKGVAGTLTAVNRGTKHPNEALEFLELMNTDRTFYNLMCFGIEGKHYVLTDKALGVVGFPEGVTAANDRYNPNTDWQFGNQFNAYYRSAEDARTKRWERQAALNKEAKKSKILGFTPNPDPVKNEIASVSAVSQQFGKAIELGLVDPADGTKGIPAYLKAQETAGLSKIQSEIQRQLHDWAKRK